MTGHEAFHKMVLDSGIPSRKFAKLHGITTSALGYYERGDISLLNISVKTALQLFEGFNTSVYGFYLKYYRLKDEVDAGLSEYRRSHPVRLEYDVLHQRLYNRLRRIFTRKRINNKDFGRIWENFLDVFETLNSRIDENGHISMDDYEKYYLPLCYDLNLSMYEVLSDQPPAIEIVKKMYANDFRFSSLADIIGVSRYRLKASLSGEYDIYRIHAGTAVKICILLGLDFDRIFDENCCNK